MTARLTRALVVASTLGAALFESYLSTQYHPFIFWSSLIGAVVLLIVGPRVRSLALTILLVAAYVTPGLLIASDPARQADFNLDVAWVLPLLALSVAGAFTRWSLPQAWQWPLVTWSVIVAVAWPIVFLREVDFAPWILPLQRVSNTSAGFSPETMAQTIVYFALLHNAGILFVDALCRWFATNRDAFTREVLIPLASAAGIAAAVAFYQGFVDLNFLNQKFWTYMIRAAGTLGDPNKLGAVMSFWTIGAVVMARRLARPWTTVVPVVAILLGAGTVWLSGSRTGLAAVIVSVSIAAFEMARHWWSNRAVVAIDFKKAALFGGAGLVLIVAMVAILQNASTHTIVQRGTLGYLPFFGDRGIANSANELLWERYGYGPAAFEMVREHPIEGVGPGTFHALVVDYGKLHGKFLVTDNAQAWWRHTLAELGLLGFIPVVWWCVTFGRQMFSRHREGDRMSIGMLRGVLIGFFIASLFGVPAQALAITVTFWVFAFWTLIEIGPLPTRDWNWSKAATGATLALVVLHAGATTVDAFGSLRPLERARRWNWYYRYGWVFIQDELEKDPGGNPIGRRWTLKKSLSLVRVQGRTMQFVAWVEHPDADQKPVHVRVWADSVKVYDGLLKRGQPISLDIPPRPGEEYVVMETEIDRLFRPSDYDPRSRDRRELGLSVRDWQWK